LAGLHCVALIEANKETRESLALVLTSTGGMEVVCFASMDDYIACQEDKKSIQLILLSVGALKQKPPQLDHPFCYYGQSEVEVSPPIPFVPLLTHRIAAFPEQLCQCYRQLISKE
jgi:hypothetical protein